MSESLESGSNLTVESALHSLKQALPMTSTERGMQMDESD
jgi:hypothetical protein